MEDGAVYSARCDRPRGIWGNPLTREERLIKVRQCASRVLSGQDVEGIIETVEDLDHGNERDVVELLELLAGPSPD